jgi:hypothetical protein
MKIAAILAFCVLLLVLIDYPSRKFVFDYEKAKDAMTWLAQVDAAQAKVFRESGHYSTKLPKTVARFPPKWFAPGRIELTTTDGRPGWRIVLTRFSLQEKTCDWMMGCYTITYSAPSGKLECSNPSCASQMLSAIQMDLDEKKEAPARRPAPR